MGTDMPDDLADENAVDKAFERASGLALDREFEERTVPDTDPLMIEDDTSEDMGLGEPLTTKRKSPNKDDMDLGL